jgi:hypothetical protein
MFKTKGRSDAALSFIGPAHPPNRHRRVAGRCSRARQSGRCRPQHRFRFDVSGRGPEQVPEIERCRRIRWIALHQNAVEALSFSNVSGLLSRLRFLKQIIGIVLKSIHRKHKLAVLVSTSIRPFEFEAVVRSGTETHIGQAAIRQPFLDLAHGTNDLG